MRENSKRIMTKKYATKQFSQFLPMIEKATWHYSRKYHLDRADLEGQSFLIFCEALETWDKDISTFSTHLTHKLHRLDAYCRTTLSRSQSIKRCKSNYGRGYGKSIRMPFMNITEIDTIFNYDIFDKVITKMDYEISLSDDAKIIVEYILSREWEDVEINWKPRFGYIQKKYLNSGWTRDRIGKAWENIIQWWQSSNKDQFCLEV